MQTGSLGTWQNQVCAHRCWLDLPTYLLLPFRKPAGNGSAEHRHFNGSGMKGGRMFIQFVASQSPVCFSSLCSCFPARLELNSGKADSCMVHKDEHECVTERVCVCTCEMLSCCKWNSRTPPAAVCVCIQKKQATSTRKARNKTSKTYSPSEPLAKSPVTIFSNFPLTFFLFFLTSGLLTLLEHSNLK